MQPILLRGCSVRLATSTDINALTSLLSECFLRPYLAVYQEWRDRNAQSNNLTLVAVVGDAIVGVLELSMIKPDAIYLSSLAVNLNFRNQGIATKLLSEAQAIASFLGVNNLCLHALPVEKTLRLYLKNGFQFWEVQPTTSEMVVLLHKQLITKEKGR